jgi:hypothetical protein
MRQALNLVTQVSYSSRSCAASRTSTNLDAKDVMDDLDVATDVATRPQLGGRASEFNTLPPRWQVGVIVDDQDARAHRAILAPHCVVDIRAGPGQWRR